MSLQACLHSLCGYGVSLLNRGGRLVIRSATYQLSEIQTTTLKQHKALLLMILPENTAQLPGDLLDAIEAYDERTAIIAESGVDQVTINTIATAQARSVLLSMNS